MINILKDKTLFIWKFFEILHFHLWSSHEAVRQAKANFFLPNLKNLLFAGWRRERKEVQVLQSLVFGSGPDAGPPGFVSVFFQPEIPVEPQSGQGKNKHQLAVGQVVGLNLPLPAVKCRFGDGWMKDTQRQNRPDRIKGKKIILQ